MYIDVIELQPQTEQLGRLASNTNIFVVTLTSTLLNRLHNAGKLSSVLTKSEGRKHYSHGLSYFRLRFRTYPCVETIKKKAIVALSSKCFNISPSWSSGSDFDIILAKFSQLHFSSKPHNIARRTVTQKKGII